MTWVTPWICRLAEAGHTPQEISEKLQVSLAIVVSWMKRHGYDSAAAL